MPHAAGGLAFAYSRSGDRKAAVHLLNDLKRRFDREYVPPMFIAEAYAALGDTNRAFEWLERGIDQKDIYIPENFFEPLLDPLRNDPRFGRVLERMGLER
jgi:hypothetical protein